MKLITKILDTYYSDKLVALITRILYNRYNIDIRVTTGEQYIRIEIKKTIYNDEQYKTIFAFKKEDSFSYICNQSKLIEVVSNCADDILGKENRI